MVDCDAQPTELPFIPLPTYRFYYDEEVALFDFFFECVVMTIIKFAGLEATASNGRSGCLLAGREGK